MANILIRGGNETQTMSILSALLGKIGLQIVKVTDQYELVMPNDDKPSRRKTSEGGETE